MLKMLFCRLQESTDNGIHTAHNQNEKSGWERQRECQLPAGPARVPFFLPEHIERKSRIQVFSEMFISFQIQKEIKQVFYFVCVCICVCVCVYGTQTHVVATPTPYSRLNQWHVIKIFKNFP